MPETKLDDKTLTEQDENTPNLKGTFISVMFIGVVIIVSWIGVWALFVSR